MWTAGPDYASLDGAEAEVIHTVTAELTSAALQVSIDGGEAVTAALTTPLGGDGQVQLMDGVVGDLLEVRLTQGRVLAPAERLHSPPARWSTGEGD